MRVVVATALPTGLTMSDEVLCTAAMRLRRDSHNSIMNRRRRLSIALTATLPIAWALSGCVAHRCAVGAESNVHDRVEVQHSALRTRRGLLALYDFGETEGEVVKDRSEVGQSLDLFISNTDSVRRHQGSLEVLDKVMIGSKGPAAKLNESIRRSGEITIEAWVQSADTSQQGPARIITLSRSGTERNFTLGQDKDRFDVRFRTLNTNANGLPSVRSPDEAVTSKLAHVVYTRDRSGRARIYLDGKRSKQGNVSGDTFNWHGQFRLALANELNGSRPWLGSYFLVAIYNRDLLPEEIEQNYQAGPNPELVPGSLARADPDAEFFDTSIAPLLSKHCLECHDSASKQGDLDLSRRAAALAGGESGPLIVAGNSAESLMWDLVTTDEMPQDRPPLTDREKALIRKWIDDGGHWSMEVIDPAVYVHDGGSDENYVQRLTVDEYVESVRAALGVDIEQEARELLPADLRADGFSNTAYNLNVGLKHVEAYAQLAELIVQRLDIVQFAQRFSKSRKLTDNDMRGLIAAMGNWILRGPLAEHELTTYRGISTTVASAGGNFEEAVSLVVEAMLQSPRFLYRVEDQRGDGTRWPVGDYELACRLSYILWGAPPDEELMRAVESGAFYDRGHVESQARRMLEDPRAKNRSMQFIDQWLDLGRLEHLRPNVQKFPKWDSRLAGDMRAETLAYFEEIVWTQSRPLSDLLDAQFTYVTPRLARHYHFKLDATKPINRAPANVAHPDSVATDDQLRRWDLSSVPSRGGLLTHGSVLTVGGDEASMVTRGLLVLHELLRGVVKDPPPCVDTTPVPTKEGLTQRGVAEARIANESCGGCHAKFEPLAFGLEKFDGLGAYRDTDEHGNRLRDDGEVLFPGDASPMRYQSAAELMNTLAKSDRVRQTMTWKVTQFALGRPLVPADARILDKIHRAAQEGGGTYASLMTAIVTSELVLTTRTESND